MASISLRNIQKRYGETEVVKGLDLEIADGEFIVLVGPSGCGKSTTLRMIAGLESISAGELQIDGKRVNEAAPGERDLAMVFQSYALYPHMSVRENIAYGLKVRGHSRTDIATRTDEVAKMLGLEALLDRKPSQLSGGQRQRVAMGRAIVRRPKAFLFDEPLSNLDAKLRTEVRAEIARLRRSLGTTTVYVTHDQVEAMTLADRVVVMNGGIAQQIGAPMEVYRQPANRFVAAFLGTPTMNFFEGRAEGQGFLTDAKAALSIATPQQTSCVAVRPHDLVAGGSEGVPFGTLQVDYIERLGAESFAFGALGSTRACAKLAESSQPQPGDAIPLVCVPDRLHFFDNIGVRVEA
ncbi:MAG: ABC transporter ATP-binding protein [Myxococcota bacterium]